MVRRRWSQEEINEFRNAKGNIFYYNKEDSNFVASRELGIGWSFNWANPISWVLTVAIVGVIITTSIFFN